MKLYAPICLLLFFFLFVPTPAYAADEPIVKTFCATTFGYPNLDALKADLLTNAKRDAVSELFGELIAASTTVDDFVVTSDQIRASSIGFVRIEGNVSFYNGENLAEVCVTIHAYATDDDRKQFQPIQLNKRNCVTDANLTTSALTAFAKQEAIVQALIDYDGKLATKEKAYLVPFLQRVNYIESAFVAETETYCVRVTGEVIPIEVLAFLDAGELLTSVDETSSDSATAEGASPTTTQTPVTTDGSDATPSTDFVKEVECSLSIEIGQMMECEIEQVAQKVSHEFMAAADDVIIVTVVETRGDLSPEFSIRNADGDVVQNDEPCQIWEWDIAQYVCRIPEAGQYSILMASHSQHMGEYSLRLQRLNNPAAATPIEFGQTIEGRIDSASDFEYYSFLAEARDHVIVTVVETEGDLSPSLAIYDDSGDVVEIDQLCQTWEWDIAQYVCRVPKAGTYSIRIWSNDRNNTGAYSLRLQRLNNPAGATPIEFGQTIESSIDSASEFEYYSFSAEAKEEVIVTVVETEGDLSPGLQIYNADGVVVKGDEPCWIWGWDIAQYVCKMPEAGTYSIRVLSNDRNHTGSYSLTLDRN